jgi:DNA-binding transcriptional ArsR family regulator
MVKSTPLIQGPSVMDLQELESKALEAEGFLKAFANRHRLMIMCQLKDTEKSVTSLQEAVGLSQSAMSQHLARLRADDLVKTRRKAQTIYYSLASPDVERLIGLLYELFCNGERKPAKKSKK